MSNREPIKRSIWEWCDEMVLYKNIIAEVLLRRMSEQGVRQIVEGDEYV